MAATKTTLLEPDFLGKLERLGFITRKLFKGRMKGERRSKKLGTSVEFADYRDYAAGDDLRFIDWNVYARLDRLLLKLFMEEEDLFIYLIVDTSQSMSFGDPSKLDYAKRVAASLGYIGLTSLERVNVSAFAGQLSSALPSTRGRSGVWRLFDAIDGLECDGDTSLEKSLQDFALRYSRAGIVIVLSDFLDPRGYEAGLKYLLQRSFDVCLIHTLAPEDVEPPVNGHLRLYDSETNDFTEITASEVLLKTYRRTYQAFTSSLKDFCSRSGMSYMQTTTDQPFDKLVLESLRRGGMLR